MKKKLYAIVSLVLTMSLSAPVAVMAADTSNIPITTSLPGTEQKKAVLENYSYKQGTFSAEAWNSDFLQMRYIAPQGYEISADFQDKMQEYYLRNGSEEQIASNEMVVLGPDGDYMQMMVETNPNAESAYDILNQFAKKENFSISTISNTSTEERIDENHIMKKNISGKELNYCVGNIDGEAYLLGICVNGSDPIIAIKVKSESVDGRENILSGFQEYTAQEVSDNIEENTTDNKETEEVRGTAIAKHLWELD